VDIPRQPQEEKILRYQSIVAIDLNINITADHSWFEDHALYLVDQKDLVYYELLKAWRFHYGRSVSATIDSFELCIARKIRIRAKT